MTDTAQTGIRVTAKHNPLFWVLAFFKPHAVIDGADTKIAWKDPAFFPVAVGQHEVVVYFPYLIPPKAGKGKVSVTVNPGQVVEVGYKAPWFVFFKGKMQVS
jgi:hypothetical protein